MQKWASPSPRIISPSVLVPNATISLSHLPTKFFSFWNLDLDWLRLVVKIVYSLFTHRTHLHGEFQSQAILLIYVGCLTFSLFLLSMILAFAQSSLCTHHQVRRRINCWFTPRQTWEWAQPKRSTSATRTRRWACSVTPTQQPAWYGHGSTKRYASAPQCCTSWWNTSWYVGTSS